MNAAFQIGGFQPFCHIITLAPRQGRLIHLGAEVFFTLLVWQFMLEN